MFGIPAPFLIPILGIIFGTTMTAILLYPFARAYAKRLEGRPENRGGQQLSPDVVARLARIEAAVESIAVEVERISESQRFLAKLQAGKPALPGAGGDADRH
jgi:hypothetical protein